LIIICKVPSVVNREMQKILKTFQHSLLPDLREKINAIYKH